MAEKLDQRTNGCTFQWDVENISHCWIKQGEVLESSIFFSTELNSTKWSFMLFPKGNEDKNYIKLYLKREEDCSGPNPININFLLALLRKDGSSLKEIYFTKRWIRKSHFGGFLQEKRETVFVTERESFLAEDTLRIKCTIWDSTENISTNPEYIYKRSILNVNRRYLVFKVERVSNLKFGLRKKFKDNLIDIDFVLNEGFDRIDIDLISLDEKVIFISCDVRVIDFEGKKENLGLKNYSLDKKRKGVLSPTLFCPNVLMQNKSRYLQNDALSLEFVFFTCEYFDSGVFPNLQDESFFPTYDRKENSLITTVLTDDLKSMYNAGIFSDIELRTSTKTFPAHKIILSARSVVFRNMFSHNMKEKNSGKVDIKDMEDDTVRRMLLHIYTDSLEDLQLESASKLYAAADKYEILSLKSRCSSFLKDNLCPNKVCNILTLADLHQDNDLKSFVESYILEHDKEVIGCPEWKDFMDANLKLAADIMYRKLFSA